jgi:uncharacterized protein (TIRG00374 family)
MSNRTKKTWKAGRIVQVVLAVLGVGLFAMLVREVDFTGIPSWSPHSLPLLILAIILLTMVNYTIETVSWWLVCGKKRPSLWTLISIRLRGEALTNTLPGGALIGEPMKVGMLMRSTSMSRAEATTAFLLGKFTLISGQAAYVVAALAVSYELINAASQRVFKTDDVAVLVLCAAGGIFVLLASLLAAMIWFQPMRRWLVPTAKDTKWTERWNTLVLELHRVEEMMAEATRRQGARMTVAFLFAFIAWSLNGVEAFLILRWLQIDVTLLDAYAIDGVSSVVRMVVFVIPIGLGGQDWTIAGLMTVHGIASPVEVSARLVVLKRAREFTVIGIGLLMLLVSARRFKVLAAEVEREELGG